MHTDEALPVSKRPIYSPRTSMSNYIRELDEKKTNLAINIDKETLLLFKSEFERCSNNLSAAEFVSSGIRILKSWQKDLPYR